MKITVLLTLFGLSFFLSGCGATAEEPEYIVGEDQASDVVHAFMHALEAYDFDKARSYLYEKPDYLLEDCGKMRALFYTFKPTGMETLNVEHHFYGMDWHIQVDLKLKYGDKMKRVRFSLVKGSPPKLRGLRALTL